MFKKQRHISEYLFNSRVKDFEDSPSLQAHVSAACGRRHSQILCPQVEWWRRRVLFSAVNLNTNLDFTQCWIWSNHNFLWCCFICTVSGRSLFSLCNVYKYETFYGKVLCLNYISLVSICWFGFVLTHRMWRQCVNGADAPHSVILICSNCKLPSKFICKQQINTQCCDNC